MTTIFEQANGTYVSAGDYLLPALSIPSDKEYHIGLFGQRHRTYLKEQHKILYYNLLTSGKLLGYLDDVNARADTLYTSLFQAFAAQESLTEELKTSNPSRWIYHHNNIKNRVMEIINEEIIYNVWSWSLMKKKKKFHLYLTHREYIFILKSLFNLRNSLIENNHFSDGVDDVILKFNNAKQVNLWFK